jgi:hypothetical protein
VVWSFVYVAFCRLLQVVVLLVRSDRSKELEIWCSGMSWRSCAGSPRRARFRPWIGRSWRRSRGPYRGAPGRVCRSVQRPVLRLARGVGQGAGRIRTGRRAATARSSLPASVVRLARENSDWVKGGSSANCGA